MADRIMRLERNELFICLKDHLSIMQIKSIWDRICLLKRIIKSERIVMLNENEWSEDTILEEISGKYGKTNLVTFITAYMNITG